MTYGVERLENWIPVLDDTLNIDRVDPTLRLFGSMHAPSFCLAPPLWQMAERPIGGTEET
jgi:hypothetical protein